MLFKDIGSDELRMHRAHTRGVTRLDLLLPAEPVCPPRYRTRRNQRHGFGRWRCLHLLHWNNAILQCAGQVWSHNHSHSHNQNMSKSLFDSYLYIFINFHCLCVTCTVLYWVSTDWHVIIWFSNLWTYLTKYNVQCNSIQATKATQLLIILVADTKFKGSRYIATFTLT